MGRTRHVAVEPIRSCDDVVEGDRSRNSVAPKIEHGGHSSASDTEQAMKVAPARAAAAKSGKFEQSVGGALEHQLCYGVPADANEVGG